MARAAVTPASAGSGRRLRRADRVPSPLSPPVLSGPVLSGAARARRRPDAGMASVSGADCAAGTGTEDLEPGRASTKTTSRAAASAPRLRFLAVSLRVITRWPPPAGRVKPCAQPLTGAARAVSGLPLRVADQPPAASASTRVPEVPGASVSFTPTDPEGTGTAVPDGVTTRARATVPETCHRSYEDDRVSGCRPAAVFNWPASAWSAGSASRT